MGGGDGYGGVSETVGGEDVPPGPHGMHREEREVEGEGVDAGAERL